MSESAAGTVKGVKRRPAVGILVSIVWLLGLYFLGIAIPTVILMTGAFGILDCTSFAICNPTDKTMPFFSTIGNYFNYLGPAVWLIMLVNGKLPGTSRYVREKS